MLVILVLMFVLGPLSVLKNPLFLGVNSVGSLATFLQRSISLIAFQLLAVMILIGLFMEILEKKYGKWALLTHRGIGITSFLLVLLHPFALFVGNFIYRRVIDPFYIFTDFCLLCETKTEMFITLGRISFWLFSLVVLVAILRKENWWRENWKYFHKLSYLGFILVSVHAWRLGSDIHSTIYYPVFLICIILVVLASLYKFCFVKK